MIKNDYIIQGFIKTKFFTDLCKNRNMICAFVGGSRMVGLDNDKSDYDIQIITDDNIGYKDIAHIKYFYNGKELTISTQDVSDMLTYNNLYKAIGILYVLFIDYDNIIYYNKKYKTVIDYICNSKQFYDSIMKASLYAMYYKYDFNIIRNIEHFDQNNFYKQYYTLCFAYFNVIGETIDYDFLRKIKSANYFDNNKLDENTEQRLINTLLLIDKYISTNQFDWEQAIECWNIQIYNKFLEVKNL